MKYILFFLATGILLSACQKHLPVTANTYLQNIKVALYDSLGADNFGALDFKKARLTKLFGDSVFLLKIPFRDKMILVKTSRYGRELEGRIIKLSTTAVIKPGIRQKAFNGHIRIQSLQEKELINSEVENGFIKTVQTAKRAQVTPDPYVELPEVVIVSTYSSSDVFDFSFWLSMASVFDSYGGGGGNYYSSYTDGGESYTGGGGSGGGGDYSNTEPVPLEPPITIDFESVVDKEAIDVASYIKCFDNIPDAGAVCSIEIFADIPVNGDPSRFFDWENESPGHCFIQIKKENGSGVVQQNIGFYPVKNWKVMLTTAPVAGKFVDNAGHEYNASLKMNVSPVNFRHILTNILYLSRFVRYDIDDYNCADFALEVFNSVRQEKLEIPKYDIPGGMAPYGTNTPQGLYQKLEQMKNKNHPEAVSITTGILKGWVGKSEGSCN